MLLFHYMIYNLLHVTRESLGHQIALRVDEWVIMVFSTNLVLILNGMTICLNILGWYLNYFS